MGGFPTSLKQGCFIYLQNQVLQCLTAELKKFLSTAGIVSVYADLPGLCASDSPQATAPPTILVTSYRPDIVLCSGSNKVVLLELTCPLDSVEHLKSVRVWKQEKREYARVTIRIWLLRNYDTIELSVLGHYLPDSLAAFLKCVNFIQDEVKISKSACRRIFDLAASISISSSRRIFLARDCFEWFGDSWTLLSSYCVFCVYVSCVTVNIYFLAIPTCTTFYCLLCGSVWPRTHLLLFIIFFCTLQFTFIINVGFSLLPNPYLPVNWRDFPVN